MLLPPFSKDDLYFVLIGCAVTMVLPVATYCTEKQVTQRHCVWQAFIEISSLCVAGEEGGEEAQLNTHVQPHHKLKGITLGHGPTNHRYGWMMLLLTIDNIIALEARWAFHHPCLFYLYLNFPLIGENTWLFSSAAVLSEWDIVL